MHEPSFIPSLQDKSKMDADKIALNAAPVKKGKRGHVAPSEPSTKKSPQ